MFEKIRKMKNKKGFTLVELIVVLVILAILAALLVPALTGYIDKANKEKVIATTRSVVVAAQTEVSEKYGLKASGALTPATIGTNIALTKSDDIDIDKIVVLAEVGTDKSNLKNGIDYIKVTYTDKGVVTNVEVKQSGFTCKYDANSTGDKYSVS